MRAFGKKYNREGLQHNLKIHPQGHVADVIEVQDHHLFKGHRASSQCLPQSRASRKDIEPFLEPRGKWEAEWPDVWPNLGLPSA